MTLTAKLLVATAALAFIPIAYAGKLESCPDPAAAKQYVKACLQENPYNTQQACEERALKELCSGK